MSQETFLITSNDSQTDVIHEVLKLLQEKHDAVPEERYSHYVAKGEYEEDFGSDEYCEDCIDKGVRKYIDMWRQKRGLEMSQVRQLKSHGYIIFNSWNPQYECKAIQMHCPSKKEKNKYIKDILKKYKEEPEAIFSYRYYQRSSDTTTRCCDGCGKPINVSVTADEQEIEHWESLEDSEFILSEMDNNTAYDLYEVMQFIYQADKDVYERGMKIAEKIILLNNFKTETPLHNKTTSS